MRGTTIHIRMLGFVIQVRISTTIHSKPRLIPLLYHTREGTLKNA